MKKLKYILGLSTLLLCNMAVPAQITSADNSRSVIERSRMNKILQKQLEIDSTLSGRVCDILLQYKKDCAQLTKQFALASQPYQSGMLTIDQKRENSLKLILSAKQLERLYLSKENEERHRIRVNDVQKRSRERMIAKKPISGSKAQ